MRGDSHLEKDYQFLLLFFSSNFFFFFGGGGGGGGGGGRGLSETKYLFILHFLEKIN